MPGARGLPLEMGDFVPPAGTGAGSGARSAVTVRCMTAPDAGAPSSSSPAAPVHPAPPSSAAPPAIVVATAAYALLAGLLGWAWLGLGDSGGADGESVDMIRGQLGSDAVSAGGSGGFFAVAAPVLGLIMVLMAVGLVLGRRWTVWPLTLSAVAAVLLLASGGRWETLVAMVLLAVATVALLLPRRSRQYLGR